MNWVLAAAAFVAGGTVGSWIARSEAKRRREADTRIALYETVERN